MKNQSLSADISDFVLGLKYEDIPEDTINHVKLLMIDTFGCVLSATKESHVPCVKNAVESLINDPQATLWGTSTKLTLDHAVMYNGCLIHGMDFDDTHPGAIIHPSASVLNVAVTLGEYLGKSGKEILTAMVAGYEILLRLGIACKGKLHETFFHPTGVFAPFATICIAGRYLNIDKNTLINAMGLAGSFAGGLQQYTVDGSWNKKLHPGWGAHAGLYALRFAQQGFSGSPEIFEGSQGLFISHIGTAEYLSSSFSDLGHRWVTNEIAFKFYPVCHMMHSHIDILLDLMEKNNFCAADIENIHAILSPRAFSVIAFPPEQKKHPASDFHMRFSIQYVLSIAALHRQLSSNDIDMKLLSDPDVVNMIDRITVESKSEAEVPGHFPGEVIITLKDGRVFHCSQKYETGSAEKPATRENVLRKYYANASPYLSSLESQNLISYVDAFESLNNVDKIISLLNLEHTS